MGHSLNGARWRAIASLSAELLEHPIHDVDGSYARLLDWFCDSMGARSAFVVLAAREATALEDQRRDPLSGWRPRRVIYHRESPEIIRVRRAWHAETSGRAPDLHTQALARTAGRHRAALRRNLVDDAAWARCRFSNELWPRVGIGDQLMGASAADPRAEVFFGIDRATGDRPFGEREKAVMAAVVVQTAWLHRRFAWSHGLIRASGLLTPREREIVANLLSSRSEKQVAAALGLTERTTHQYVVGVYRKLGVGSRAELIARFLHAASPLDAKAPRQLPYFPHPPRLGPARR